MNAHGLALQVGICLSKTGKCHSLTICKTCEENGLYACTCNAFCRLMWFPAQCHALGELIVPPFFLARSDYSWV